MKLQRDTARPAPAATAAAPLSFAQVLLAAAEAPDLRKAKRTRLRLLASIAATLAQGVEQGELRVADVTTRAGLAHGTFYRYFPELRSAVEVLVCDFSAFLRDRLAEARDGMAGSRERVRSATLAYIRLIRANAGLMRCLVSLGGDSLAFRQAFQELNRAWNERTAAAIARRRATPSSKRVSAAGLLPTAYALGGMVDEFLIQLYLRQDPALAHLADKEEAVADLLTELWCLGAYGRLPRSLEG